MKITHLRFLASRCDHELEATQENNSETIAN